MIRALPHILGALALATPAMGLDLQLPGSARLVLEETAPMAMYDIPTGPWTPAAFERDTAEGGFTRLVWQVAAYAGTTAQLLQPLRDQLEGAGYETEFTCTDAACGGFDFRFALDITPEPEMHVNLGDFAYLSARAAEDGRVALLISRGGGTGFVHLVHIGPEGAAAPEVTLSSRTPGPDAVSDPDDVIAAMQENGRATLDDLRFDTGAATLSGRDYPSLRALATFLAANPDTQIVLVGHTDAEGALDSNIALSRSRAAAVRDHLITVHDIPPEQIRAEGVGYLAPRAPNSTGEGRQMNRRVEVVQTTIPD